MIHLTARAATTASASASAWLLVCASFIVISGCAQVQAQAQSQTQTETQTQAAADATLVLRGQRLFLRCASCHDVAGSDIVKNGPSLKDVVGRRVAGVDGYGYSKSLASLTGVWDDLRLDQWLEKPTALAPGTTMAFEGMANAAERKALIAYLRAPRP